MIDREAVIGWDESPPLLVVEVVSPSTKGEDYRAKQWEYCFLDIPEYWIVDPLENQVTVCTLATREYKLIELRGEETIQSPTFPNFKLTAAQVLSRKL